VKSKRVLAAILALSIGAGAGFVGCGNNDKKDNANKGNETEGNKTEGNEDKGADLDKDQYLNIFLGAEPKSLDPSRSSDTYSTDILTHIVDGLTRIEQDKDGKDMIVPGIAEKWDVSEDGTKWTFHLRDAKWADGQAVTAKDFVYGITRTLDPNTGSNYAWIIKDVIKGASDFNDGNAGADTLGVKAIDDKTLEVELTSPVAYFLDLTYFRVMLPQREDIVAKYGEAFGSEAEHMMANGPFVLNEWVHDNKVVFDKNPNYWNAEEVKLDKLNMLIVKDEGARMNMMLNGQVDLGGVAKPEWMEKFDKTGNYDFTSVAKPSAVYELFNQTSRYLKNEKIRKAFIVALDREAINETLYKGRYVAAESWCPPAVQIGGEDFREKAGADANWITKLKEENPDAKALLIEGLKELGEDPDPSKMEISMLQSGTNSTSREFAEFEQRRLEEVLGIKVKIDYYEWAIFQKKIDDFEYDIASQGWNGDYNDPMTFFEMFASYSNMYSTGWKNDRYDELMKLSTQTNDNEKRFEYFKEAEKILLYDDAAISPWIFRKSSTYMRKYANNVMTPLFGGIDCSKAYTTGR
jgi:oligopeptide transport system substrate-binding protein